MPSLGLAKMLTSSSYDVFFADDRVVTFLPGLMGKAFYDTKRNPIPVRVKVYATGQASLLTFLGS